ncbi:site-specific DNA-methyltransferase, partial [Patescibacteria group bacterium]
MKIKKTYNELLLEVETLKVKNKKLEKRKKFGLVWENKPEKFDKEKTDSLPVLKEKGGKFKDIVSNKEEDFNILIEGDNYHSLSVLNYTHRGKIDVIYIDPPYNTGNKDFTYNDRFVDKEDGFRQSKWLSFMEKRLRLAKDLLSKKGVIFISIDENEMAQLKLLCDEVFGLDNLSANFVWKTRQASGKQISVSNVSIEHEYILAYTKNKKTSFLGVPRDRNQYKNPDNDLRGIWAKHPLDVGSTKEERPNCFYTITDPKTGNEYEANSNRVWAFSKESMSRLISEDKIIFNPTGKTRPYLKKFWNELKTEFKPISSWVRVSEVGYNTEGTKILNDIFCGKKVFDYPKPLSLIKRFINQISKDNSLILDFMAGSGTTGQTVLELNKEDGGNRKFILCTNNENKICEDITYQRIKKVVNGYKKPNDEKVEALGGNLKYLKTD